MQKLKEVLEEHTIVVEDPLLRRGFTAVPNLLFALKGLSHGARLTYVLLLKYAWQKGSCFPGVETLGADLGVERKSVMRYTHELQNNGLITIKRRGLGKTNVYRINRLEAHVVSKLKSHRRDIWKSGRCDPNNTQRKKTQKKKTQR
jgi:hypothetical protein